MIAIAWAVVFASLVLAGTAYDLAKNLSEAAKIVMAVPTILAFMAVIIASFAGDKK